MIPTQQLERLARNLVAAVVAGGEETEPSTALRREWLSDFAGEHDLDLEDFSTLLRVAAGEGTMLQAWEHVTAGVRANAEPITVDTPRSWRVKPGYQVALLNRPIFLAGDVFTATDAELQSARAFDFVTPA